MAYCLHTERIVLQLSALQTGHSKEHVIKIQGLGNRIQNNQTRPTQFDCSEQNSFDILFVYAWYYSYYLLIKHK